MNIQEELLKNHSKEQAEKITNYACSSKKHVEELMQCYLSKDSVVAQRAAWSVGKVVDEHKNLIIPYLPILVEQLTRKDVHGSIIRSALRVLQEVVIPENLHGDVMNACFAFVENPASEIAHKAFSLTILFNLSKIYPELKNELKLIIEERWDTESAAFKSRGRHILRRIG